MSLYLKIQRHKVFVSYHHANDQAYRDHFEHLFARTHDVLVPWSVQIGDIDENMPTETIRQRIRDEYLRDSTVTVVLVGSETWKRKHVDWEIGSSIRHTTYNPRSGLLGIILPTYPRNRSGIYNPRTIPPRLHDNIKSGFARIYDWNDDPLVVGQWVHEAFQRRHTVTPNNSRISFGNNRSGQEWQP